MEPNVNSLMHSNGNYKDSLVTSYETFKESYAIIWNIQILYFRIK